MNSILRKKNKTRCLYEDNNYMICFTKGNGVYGQVWCEKIRASMAAQNATRDFEWIVSGFSEVSTI